MVPEETEDKRWAPSESLATVLNVDDHHVVFVTRTHTNTHTHVCLLQRNVVDRRILVTLQSQSQPRTVPAAGHTHTHTHSQQDSFCFYTNFSTLLCTNDTWTEPQVMQMFVTRLIAPLWWHVLICAVPRGLHMFTPASPSKHCYIVCVRTQTVTRCSKNHRLFCGSCQRFL